MPALPDSVCRNVRSGAGRLRDHAVRPENGSVGVAGSVRATSSGCRGQDHHRDRNTASLSVIVDAVIFRRAVAEDILAIVTLQQEGGVLGLSHIFPQDRYPFPREETSADGIPNRRSHGGSI
jgi:hypothetical protein